MSKKGTLRAYPKYKDSGVEWLGEVPEHWVNQKISHSYRYVGGGTTPPSSEAFWYDEGIIPWVTTGELREAIIYDTKKMVTREAVATFSSLKVHPKGALLIALYGATIGRMGFLGVTASCNQACCVLADPISLDTKYTFYWLLSFREEIIKSYSTGGGQPNISQEIVLGIRIPAPALEEQTQIVDFLDHETQKIDALIEEQERLVGLLQEKRQAVISHAVTKGLDPDVPLKDSGVEWLGEVPEHWEVTTLRWLVRMRSGDAITSSDIEEEGEFAVYGGNGIRGYTTKYTNDGHYVLIGRQGALCGNINYAKDRFWASEHALVVYPLRKVSTIWLGEVLRSLNLNQYSVSAAQPGLSVERIASLRIPQPPLEEQFKIASYLDQETQKINSLIAEAETCITLLQERRSALISAAVTGKIDVRNWQKPALASA